MAIHSVGDSERQKQTVELHDCSLGGLSFTSPDPLSPGELFTITLGIASGRRTFIYAVRHCQSYAGRYRVGADLSGYMADVDDEDPERVLAELRRERLPSQ